MSREKEETMKKLTLCLTVLLIFFCLSACNGGDTEQKTETSAEISYESTTVAEGFFDVTTLPPISNTVVKPRVFGWVSYFEMKVTPDRQTEEAYKEYIVTLFDEMKSAEVTDALIHVRAFSDAFYCSDIFPESEYIKVNGAVVFDPLAVTLSVAKEYGIAVHAWINPYRVGKASGRPEDDTIRQWYDGGSDNVFMVGDVVYLNPSSEEVQRLVIDGARELLDRYDLAGIHMDDYFYPRDCGNFDEADYNEYLSQGGTLSLGDYRRENVNSLLSGLYSAVKGYGSDKLFTVSPTGDIDTAYTEDYADVYRWLSDEGYADYVMPQIYYGFDHSSIPFASCLDKWLEADTRGAVIPGLACYKQGQEDTYAGEGRLEWIQQEDVISRQIQLALSRDCEGYALYSVSYINFS